MCPLTLHLKSLTQALTALLVDPDHWTDHQRSGISSRTRCLSFGGMVHRWPIAAACFIACRWQVDHGISIEEAGRHQLETAAHDRLDGEVLRAHRMVQAEDMPQDDISILDRTIRFNPSWQSLPPVRTVHVVAGRIALRG